MGATYFEFRLYFDDVADARGIERRIGKPGRRRNAGLAAVMTAMFDGDCEVDPDIRADAVVRENGSLLISASGGRGAEPPFEAAARLHELGCPASYLRVIYDDGDEFAFYLGDRRVGLDEFAAATQPADDTAGEGLFLPTGRVRVEARLLECAFEQDMNYNDQWLMKFATADGDEFYYRGKSKELRKLIEDEYAPDCSFVAEFEMGYLRLDAPPVAFARRPRGIGVRRIDPVTDGIASLTAGNRAFVEQPLGEIARRYVEDHGFDANAFFRQLAPDGFLGIPVGDLIARVETAEVEQFNAFGLQLRATSQHRNSLTVTVKETPIEIERAALIDHVRSFDTPPAWETEDLGYAAGWLPGNYCVSLRLFGIWYEIEFSDRLGGQYAELPLRSCLYEFSSRPSLASHADWLGLFERARVGAEAGDIDAMEVYASLLGTPRAWARDKAAADRWRRQARAAQ